MLLIVAGERLALADPLRSPTFSPGLLGRAERWLTAGAAGPTVASEPTARAPLTAERLVSEAEAEAEGRSGMGGALLRLSPCGSVIARDWRGSVKLLGNRMLLVDELRPTGSNRTVVGRIATDSRLSLFVQAGLGEWRIDPVMFPNVGSYSELAAQVATGFELRLPSGLRVASEAHYTTLYKDLHYEGVAPRILAIAFAIDGRF